LEDYQCAVVGTCLSLAELRRLARKTGLDLPQGAEEYEVHSRCVTMCKARNAFSEALNKFLDKKYQKQVWQAGKARDAGELAVGWGQALAQGDVPGGFWALLTHPLADPDLTHHAFGQVHMLSHLVGAANRNDIRRLRELERGRAELEQALEAEKVLLDPLRKRADLVLDTTNYSIHDLRRAIQEKWTSLEQEVGVLRVHIISFGFKYGVPIESDLLFDLRFLPNPYFDGELRPLSGKDKPVADFVLAKDPGRTFRKRFLGFLAYLFPLYLAEGRYRVTLALGCTGGRHRSVAVSELVCKAMRRKGYAVTLEHRHLELG
jgi:hypothetical protein